MERVYLWAVPLLCLAVFAVSSAGPAFLEIHLDNPILKASWRLQVTAAVQIPLAVIDWYRRPEASREVWRGNNPWLVLISGISLGMHFSLWVWSLSLTSLTASLLFTCLSPLLLLSGSLLLCKPVHSLEIIGTIVGFGGCIMVAFGSRSESNSSIFGDLAAFLSAVAVCFYLIIGRYLIEQRKVALFHYLCPVNLLAATTAFLFAVCYEPASAREVFSWVVEKEAGYVIYLGVVPGVIGHSLLNFLLLYMSPLLISVFVNLEPVIGSVIGWVLGMQGIPDWLTWMGGVAIMIGNIIVTLASATKPKSQEELLVKDNGASA